MSIANGVKKYQIIYAERGDGEKEKTQNAQIGLGRSA